jgi:hypothetical protein
MLALAMGNPSITHQETPYTPCRLCENFRGLHTSDIGWIFIDCAERGRYTQVDPAIGCRFWVRDREGDDAGLETSALSKAPSVDDFRPMLAAERRVKPFTDPGWQYFS